MVSRLWTMLIGVSLTSVFCVTATDLQRYPFQRHVKPSDFLPCVQVVPAFLMYPLSTLLIFKRVLGFCNQHPPASSPDRSPTACRNPSSSLLLTDAVSSRQVARGAQTTSDEAVLDISIHSRLINDATRYPYRLKSNIG